MPGILAASGTEIVAAPGVLIATQYVAYLARLTQ